MPHTKMGIAYALVLAALLFGSYSFGAGPPAPTKLGDVVQVGSTEGQPKTGYFYVTVAAAPDSDATLLPNKCVDQSFWSFVKRFFGATPPSAAAILTVRVTPSTNPSDLITVPVYSTVANSLTKDGVGSNCKTDFVARPITFTFSSNQNPKFTVDMAFHLANNTSSTAVTNILTQASSLMKLMSAGSGTPAVLSILADPTIKSLASNIDSSVSNNWTNSTDLNFSTELVPPTSGAATIDMVTFKMPSVVASGGGSRVGGNWDAGGKIFLKYSSEKFKSDGKWQDYNTVLTTTVVPSTNPGSQTNLYSIVLNGTATNGFKLASLNSSSTPESLDNACGDLGRFLASFLIPDDALVARFAVLKGSPYEKLPALRENSSCFSPKDLKTLTSLNSDYIFSEQGRASTEARDRQVGRLTAPIRTALLLRNPGVLRQLIGSPVSAFYVALGKEAADYAQGDAAIEKLSQQKIELSCFQARPGNDLSSIASLAVNAGKVTGAVVSFDANEKFAALALMPPDDVIAATGIDGSKWIDSKSAEPTCVPKPARLMSMSKSS